MGKSKSKNIENSEQYTKLTIQSLNVKCEQ